MTSPIPKRSFENKEITPRYAARAANIAIQSFNQYAAESGYLNEIIAAIAPLEEECSRIKYAVTNRLHSNTKLSPCSQGTVRHSQSRQEKDTLFRALRRRISTIHAWHDNLNLSARQFGETGSSSTDITILSLADVTRDILSLHDIFPHVGIYIDSIKPELQITVYTSEVVLFEDICEEDVHLGRFALTLKISSGARTWHVRALDPNPSQRGDGNVHPHVSLDNDVCLGDGQILVTNNLESCNILGFFETLNSVLHTYNPEDPYCHLSEWTHASHCYECSTGIREEDCRHCYQCEDGMPFCSDCVATCECGNNLCPSHGNSCSECEEAVCDECYVSCRECGGVFCSHCQEDSIYTCDKCEGTVCDNHVSFCNCGMGYCTRCCGGVLADDRESCIECGDREYFLSLTPEGYLINHKASGIVVGDQVTVTRAASGHECGWSAGWVSSMDKAIGQTGTVVVDAGGAGFHIQMAATPENTYTYPYFVLEATASADASARRIYIDGCRASGITVGNRVKITGTAKESEQGWMGSWVRNMNIAVGREGTIISDGGPAGFLIQVPGVGEHYYPYFVLEHLEPYLIRHGRSGIGENDPVLITRAATDGERGWENGWNDSMTEAVGQVGTVTDNMGALGFRVDTGGRSTWCYPYFVLEKQ